MKAMWNGACIAESDQTVVIEGNHYFPPGSIKRACFVPSDHTTYCGWKGTASYYHVSVEGQIHTNAAWTYFSPMEKAQSIRGHVAFWKDVKITDS